jgi:hypothetical protein
MSLLQPHSIVLKDMFTMPASAEAMGIQEGMDDGHPIRLGKPFTVEKLDHLLNWFHR